MKYCEKCGKELSDDATICMGCGCQTSSGEPQEQVKEKKKFGIKKILLIIVIVAAVIGVAIAGMFVWNHIRTERVKEQLAGNKYIYKEYLTFSFSEQYYEFDSNANCTYYIYLSGIDHENKYEKDYEIVFRNGSVFLEFTIGSDILEVQYNSYGNISGLYDLSEKELYD